MFFWWKSQLFLSAKPEVELILTNHSSNQNIFNVKYVENSERYNVGLKTGQIIENQQSIGTMTFDLG